MEVPGFDFVLNIVARATNRVFVGLPTCTPLHFNAGSVCVPQRYILQVGIRVF